MIRRVQAISPWTFLVALAAFSCPANPVRGELAPAAGPLVARAADSPQQELTIAQYIEKGFPSPDHSWSETEYAAFADAATKIKADGSLPLPRKGNKVTGPLFDRLVSEENLEIGKSAAIPIGTRLSAMSALMLKLPPVLFLYYDPKADRQKYGTEALEILGFFLPIEDVVFSLGQTFYDGLSEQEKANPARLDGMKKMKGGLAQSIDGILVTLTEVTHYESRDLENLAKRLPTLLPPLWPRLDKSVQQEYTIRVKKLAETHPDALIRESMTKLESALEKIR